MVVCTDLTQRRDGESLVSLSIRRHIRWHPPDARLRQLVQDFNQERPDTYLAQGMQNAVRKAFARGVERLHWDLVRV
jgi:hypothetical protein